jgi:hypothetical protein
MDMAEYEPQPIANIIERLSEIRDKLQHVNATLGYTARVEAMKQEILRHGWDSILAKYHPDVNTDDPAAYPLFELYRFVYGTMGEKQR